MPADVDTARGTVGLKWYSRQYQGPVLPLQNDGRLDRELGIFQQLMREADCVIVGRPSHGVDVYYLLHRAQNHDERPVHTALVKWQEPNFSVVGIMFLQGLARTLAVWLCAHDWKPKH